jgi:hypothetical protein
MRYLVLTLSLLLAGAVCHAAEPGVPDDALPSPYFIDEIHCSGINLPNIKEGWLLTQDEVEPARKVEEADMCERVLRVFGIEKYQWLSPDDLERTATLIRQSGSFQEADLSIRKSELKNHVHIYLKAKPNVRLTESLTENFKMYDTKGQGSTRFYNSLSGELTDHKYAPVTTNTYGVRLIGTSAASAMITDPGVLTTDDQSKMQIQDAYLAEIYWKTQAQISKHFSYDMGVRLDDDKTYSDGHSRLTYAADADILATKHVNAVNGTVFIGPAALFTTYTPYQVPTANSVKGAFLPGFIFGYDYGQAWGNHFKFKLAYYESQDDQSVLQMDFDLQKHMHLFDSYIVFGFDVHDARNAVLPEDRFPLSGPQYDNSYVGLSKIFHGADSIHQVSAVFGSESLSYASNEPTYNVNSNYVGLRYKMLDGTWNINFAASYYFQRLY